MEGERSSRSLRKFVPVHSVLSRALAVAVKDLRSELRTRYALNAVGMFVVVVATVLTFATARERLEPGTVAGILWAGIFFTASTALGRAFIAEEERGTLVLLRLVSSPIPVYIGKVLASVIESVAGSGLLLLLLVALLPDLQSADPALLATTTLLVAVAFGVALTLVSALIARAGAKGALMPVLGFPLLMPNALVGIDLLRRAVAGAPVETAGSDLALLAIYTAALAVVGAILFEFVWKE